MEQISFPLNESQIQNYLYGSDSCLAVWGRDGRVIDVNIPTLGFFGVSAKEEYHENYDKLSPLYQPDGKPSKETMRQMLESAFEHGRADFDWLHKNLSGFHFDCHIQMVVGEYEKEKVVCAFVWRRYGDDLLYTRESDSKTREAHELTQMILDSAPFVINLWDKSATLLQTSHHALELHNVSSKEEYVRNFFNLSPERQPCGALSSEMAPQYLNQAYQEGYARFEWMHCTLDGKPIPTEIILVRFERQGEFMLVAYTIDLTLSKAAAQRERDANEMYEIFHSVSPYVMNTWDEDYNLVSTSQQSMKMFGLESQEQYLERFSELSPKYQPCGTLSSEKAMNYVKQAFSSGSQVVFEWIHQTLHGELLPSEITLMRYTHRGRNMVAAFTVDLRPVKAAMNMERERELHERVRLFFDASPTGVSIYDENLCLVDCSRSVVTMFGFDEKKDFVTEFSKPLPVLSPKYQPCGTLSTEKSKAIIDKISSERYARFEWMHCDADGNELPTETTIVVVSYKDTYAIVSYISDLREIKAAQEAVEVAREKMFLAELAEESNKAKSNFLAYMSHEIRTPITAVMGISKIQLQSPSLPKHIEESFSEIYNSSNLLLGIVNDILDISKIDAGKMEILCDVYDVASMINDISHLHISFIGNKDIDFTLSVDESLPAFLVGDVIRIVQVINNVMSNAFKYTEHGTVTLSVSCDADKEKNNHIMLNISARDTGMGMTTEQLEALKIEYTRFHEREHRHISGIGLGMPIVYSLIDMMDAHIKITSEVGEGTIVTINIPQEIAEQNKKSTLGIKKARSLEQFETIIQKNNYKITSEPMPYGRVLVVDDTEVNLYVAQGLLAFYKLHVETCVNGYEAIDKINQGNVYDIILMDHMMPGLNGTEAMHIIRDIGYTQPIIAFTANAMIGKAEEFIENGFDGFISKPISTDQLDDILIKHIRDKQPPEIIEAAKRAAEEDRLLPKEGIRDYMEGAELKEKLRLKFAQNQKNAFSQISEALETNDIETAHRIAHTLKGLAGLIGENSLGRAAQTVASALANAQIPTDAGLYDLESELKRILEDIGTPKATPILDNQFLDKNKAIALFDSLEPLLKSKNVKSLKFLDELKTIPETAVLCRQIDNFEFAKALVTLGILKAIFEEQ